MNESGKSLEEFQRHLHNLDPEIKQARIHQLKAQQATAQKISELVGDPRWETWGRHVEAIRDSYERQRNTAREKLTEKFLVGDDYLTTKMEQVKADAAFRAINECLRVAKVLIENGEKAVEALKIIDNQEKGANNGAA